MTTNTSRKITIGSLAVALLAFTAAMLMIVTTITTNLAYQKTHNAVATRLAVQPNALTLSDAQYPGAEALKNAHTAYLHSHPDYPAPFLPAPESLEYLKSAARVLYHLLETEKVQQGDASPSLTESEYVDGLLQIYEHFSQINDATVALHLMILTLWLLHAVTWRAPDSDTLLHSMQGALQSSFLVVSLCSSLCLTLVFLATTQAGT